MSERVVIAGAGDVGRAVVELLPPDWQVAVVDDDPEALEALPAQHGAHPVERIRGDATSRLVLQRALGEGEVHLVAAVTGDDTVNTEVARLCREDFSDLVERVVCVARDAAAARASGIDPGDIVSPHEAVARIVVNRLCAAYDYVVDFGTGRGEIREVEVVEGSTAAGRALADLQPRNWLVAAIYREGDLIVPHGDTVVEPGDRVLVVGKPELMDVVTSLLRGREPLFPAQFGTHVGVAGGPTAEALGAWLAEHTHAHGTVGIDSEWVDGHELPVSEAAAAILRRGTGVLVVEPRKLSVWARMGLTRARRKMLMVSMQIPWLVARERGEWRRILLAVGERQHAETIALVAIDIARQTRCSLAVLTVAEAALSRSEEEVAAISEIPKRICKFARLHGVEHVEVRQDEGNPIERIRHHAREFDLLIVGYSRNVRTSLLSPDVSVHLLHDAPTSVLFVPWKPMAR